MTVNYNKDIVTSRPLTFLKLLLCWKASIWKAVYMELLAYLVIYAIISVVYRTAMTESQQKSFEAIVRYFDSRLSYIPLELVLGFFCTQVINRWTKLYQTIGFIDNVGLMTALYVRGTCERARRYRRNILRYCELVQVLVFRDISMRTRRRFPTLDTVVAAGFMLPHEKQVFEDYNDDEDTPKYWVPANWALAMTYKAWKHGHIESDYYKVTLQEQIKEWRTNLEWVFNYDWVPLPLMYPQVVCLAVHLYFMVTILSRQFIVADHEGKTEIDAYFPFMTVLQFVFYMGWMKVIEVLLNPFGEDDDDFETNALIDRNITMGLMIVDQGYDRPPEMRKDPFWDDEGVHPLYSEESSRIPNHPQYGSVSHIKLASTRQEVVMIPHAPSAPHHLGAGGHFPSETIPTERHEAKRSTVRVKEDERYRAREPRKHSFADSFRHVLEKVSSLVSSLYYRIIGRHFENEKKIPPTPPRKATFEFEPSVAKPTTNPLTPVNYNEKEVA